MNFFSQLKGYFMGQTSSNLEKALHTTLPEHERYFGLENFGNTCYCNSVLQSLYFCTPFRSKILNHHKQEGKKDEENLLDCLADLYHQIATQKKKTGKVAPKAFIEKLRLENELFSGFMHQDAHEFSNFLLNTVVEILMKEHMARNVSTTAHSSNTNSVTNTLPQMKKETIQENHINAKTLKTESQTPNNKKVGDNSDRMDIQDTITKNATKLQQAPENEDTGDGLFAQSSFSSIISESSPNSSFNHQITSTKRKYKTFVHEIFEGTLTTEIRCTTCENITSRDESFLDLSIDVSQNSSISACLREFSSMETLKGVNKFYCEHCCSYQEAQKSTKIKHLPQVLTLHLKRFKYFEQIQRHKKLPYRVTFPTELRLTNVINEEDQEKLFDLFAIVIHIGSGPNIGHYKCMIKSKDNWLLFDDENVDLISESEVQSVFGYCSDNFVGSSETAYILFYH